MSLLDWPHSSISMKMEINEHRVYVLKLHCIHIFEAVKEEQNSNFSCIERDKANGITPNTRFQEIA